MAINSGRFVAVGIAPEATRGNAESSPTDYIRWGELSLQDETTTTVDNDAAGVLEMDNDADNTMVMMNGSLGGNVRDKAFLRILQAALGRVTKSTDKYTFNTEQTPLQKSFTLFARDENNQSYAFAGCILASLTIRGGVNSYAGFTATFMGKKGTKISAPTLRYVEERPFLPQTTGLMIGDAVANQSTKITRYELRLVKSEEPAMFLNTDTPDDFVTTGMEATGTIELITRDEQFKDQQLANTKQKMLLSFLGKSRTESSKTLTPKIDIVHERVMYERYNRNFNLDGLMTATVDFRCLRSKDGTKFLSVEATSFYNITS